MASATFKCLTSGNTVTFTEQVDIDSMKGHPEYIRIDPNETTAKVEPVASPKKAGRPVKAIAEVNV